MKLVADSQRMTLEKLGQDYVPEKMNQSLDNAAHNPNQNTHVRLISSITSETAAASQMPALRRIEDISPIDFKRDLLETTDWHLYYKKLNSLR